MREPLGPILGQAQRLRRGHLNQCQALTTRHVGGAASHVLNLEERPEADAFHCVEPAANEKLCRELCGTSVIRFGAEQDGINAPFRHADQIEAELLGKQCARGFDDALDKVRQIFETGGRGHSCGIYSFDDEHVNQLALTAPVSRIMVRQVQSSSNAGTFTNGMPMTSSMGCGVWGGNITNENIALKHYMNVTWVSRPIPEDRPSEQELFGEFYDSDLI